MLPTSLVCVYSVQCVGSFRSPGMSGELAVSMRTRTFKQPGRITHASMHARIGCRRRRASSLHFGRVFPLTNPFLCSFFLPFTLPRILIFPITRTRHITGMAWPHTTTHPMRPQRAKRSPHNSLAGASPRPSRCAQLPLSTPSPQPPTTLKPTTAAPAPASQPASQPKGKEATEA